MLTDSEWAIVQAHAVERGCTKEAARRFAERYPEYCEFRADGTATVIGVVPRLRLALYLARENKAKQRRMAHGKRWIFDVELPVDQWSPEPYTIRILTDPDVTCVLTVLPPEFRIDMRAKVKKQFHRGVEQQHEEEPSAERVTLLPPVKIGISLGDQLRRALDEKQLDSIAK